MSRTGLFLCTLLIDSTTREWAVLRKMELLSDWTLIDATSSAPGTPVSPDTMPDTSPDIGRSTEFSTSNNESLASTIEASSEDENTMDV